jgi:hypothetical protein
MSHYLTYIVVPGKIRNIQKAVGKFLAPYDENTVVNEYQRVCRCVAWQALKEAGIPLPKLLDNPLNHDGQLFFLIHLPEDVDAYIKGWKVFIEHYGDSWFSNTSLLSLHKPDSNCVDCVGKGLILSENNPKGKWDWWVTGSDSRFYDTLCAARRKGNQKTELCDVVPVRDLNANELQLPDAIVTPDRQWHEQLYVPFVGCTIIDETAWRATLETILIENRVANLVAVDCHT